VSVSPMWSGLQQTRTPGMRSLYALPRGTGSCFSWLSPSSSRYMPSPSPVRRPALTHISFPHRRLATSARIQEKSHSAVHSPHAKSASPAQTNSPVMRAYTVTIIVQRPPAGPAKKTRCPCPLQMVGMRRTSLSHRELLKRRPGAELTVMMRCVYVEPSLSFLMHSTRRNPMRAQYIIPQDVPAHPLHCLPIHPLLPSPLCQV